MSLRRTKIVCTIGPASDSKEMLVKLIEAGMDIARLNFSHGSHEVHQQTYENIREAARETGKPVAILQDLQGPKIRTGKVENGAVELTEGQEFVLTMDDLEYGNAHRVSVSYPELANEVRPGFEILLDDGYLSLSIVRIEGNDIITTVVKGGTLKDRKGIITPGAHISAPSMSEKDVEDLKFGLALGVDAVALSFVRSERDVLELKTTMKLFGRQVPIVAKIERYEGIEDIEDIIEESNAIMVARGDLGLEMPAEDVPALQKHIIKRCNFYGKPVITATQMLESMIENPRPTRAEASDVANAVIDGSDCVMLSGETSVGKYPIEAVEYMNRIIRKAEEFHRDSAVEYDVPKDIEWNVADAIGKACKMISDQVGAAAIVSVTGSGGTAKIIAKYRPDIPILALAGSEEIVRQLAFVWGVQATMFEPQADTEERVESIKKLVLQHGVAKEGDYAILTAGLPVKKRLSTNMLRVVQL
ncbi:MAG: pyruvate kinase [Ectothiorhodospiraceae bacterium]|nr:pyruvate kinase [Ectothiorhodospiraceae bacterium]